jgi:hypothetical protein
VYLVAGHAGPPCVPPVQQMATDATFTRPRTPWSAWRATALILSAEAELLLI